MTAASLFSVLLRWRKGLAGCEVQMSDVLAKTETVPYQKHAVKGQGQRAQVAAKKILIR